MGFFPIVLLLSSKKYSVYTTVQKIHNVEHCSTVPLNIFVKYPLFERAKKQQARLWASNAGNINMFSCVVRHHLFTRWSQNNIIQCGESSATVEADSIDYGIKLQRCKSKNKWQKDHRFNNETKYPDALLIKSPLYVLTAFFICLSIFFLFFVFIASNTTHSLQYWINTPFMEGDTYSRVV